MLHTLNTFLFLLINQHAGQWPVLDGFFIWITSYITISGIVLVVLYIIGYPFLTTDPASRLRRLGVVGELALSLFLTSITVTILKVLVAAPRPFVALTHVTQLVTAAPYESFPSMHAALTMALAIGILPYHRRLGHLLIIFSFIVAFSRVFVGVHYPFDIAVGLLIGFFIPKIIHRVFVK